MQPFRTRTARDRIAEIEHFTLEQCQHALTLPVQQDSVERALLARAFRIKHEKDYPEWHRSTK
jgi:hypothetical protein